MTAFNKQPNTIIFKRMERNDEWEGYGYIGARRDNLADGMIEHVTAMDAWVVREAKELGWTDEQLFQWANSSHGRHFAEDMRYRTVERARKSFVLPQD